MYELDDFERTILLLASAVAFSRRFEELYGELQNSFSALTVEAIFNFCELPFAERITRRRVFAKSGRLVQNDLVSMDLSSRFNAPEDLLTAQIQVSNRTFGYLVGDNKLVDEFMEFSSVEEPRSQPALFREARMQDAVLFFDECEALFGDRRMGGPRRGRGDRGAARRSRARGDGRRGGQGDRICWVTCQNFGPHG